MVVLNPPYGERMEPEDIDGMYAAIGDRLKFFWPGYKAWIISSNPYALKCIGLRPNHKIKVHNGPLECRWNGYSLYSGSRFSETDSDKAPDKAPDKDSEPSSES